MAESPSIALNTYPDKVSVDIMNVTATLELRAVKNIAVWIICQEIKDAL